MTQLMRQDIDATIMWLRHSGIVGRAERQRMAARLMLGSVAAQAVVAGALRCGYCWDLGCVACAPALGGARRVESMRLAFADVRP